MNSHQQTQDQLQRTLTDHAVVNDLTDAFLDARGVDPSIRDTIPVDVMQRHYREAREHAYGALARIANRLTDVGVPTSAPASREPDWRHHAVDQKVHGTLVEEFDDGSAILLTAYTGGNNAHYGVMGWLEMTQIDAEGNTLVRTYRDENIPEPSRDVASRAGTALGSWVLIGAVIYFAAPLFTDYPPNVVEIAMALSIAFMVDLSYILGLLGVPRRRHDH